MNQKVGQARPRGKSAGQQIYDWVNECDLSQLDAVMIAVFVLVLGCGAIASCYVLGYTQRFLAKNQQPPSMVQTVITSSGAPKFAVPQRMAPYVQQLQPMQPLLPATPAGFTAANVIPIPAPALQAPRYAPPMPVYASPAPPTIEPLPSSGGTMADARFGRPRDDSQMFAQIQSGRAHASTSY